MTFYIVLFGKVFSTFLQPGICALNFTQHLKSERKNGNSTGKYKMLVKEDFIMSGFSGHYCFRRDARATLQTWPTHRGLQP